MVSTSYDLYSIGIDRNYTGYIWRAPEQGRVVSSWWCSFSVPNYGFYLSMRFWIRCYRRLLSPVSKETVSHFRSALAWARCGALFSGDRLSGRKTQPSRLASFLLVSVFLTAPGFAFEQSGHQMVAQLTIPYLNAGAKKELERLFGEDWQAALVRGAGVTELEMLRPKNASLIPMQYTLFDVGAEGFDAATDCPEGVCSVGAVLESLQVLQKANFDDGQKRQALRYLMHFNLLLHIPMNSGLKRDEGGQKIFVDNDQLKPVSLAWIWNYDLYRKQNQHWFSYAKELYREMEDLDLDAWAVSLKPQDWAFETHKLALEEAYPLAAEGRYSAELISKSQELLETQLMKAAYRTAVLLNQLFPMEQEEMAG